MDASEILPSHGLFHGLGKDEIRSIGLRTEMREYKPGEPAIEEGKMSPGVFFIVSGSFEVLKRAGKTGKRVPLAKLGKGEFFGEMEFLDSGPVHATVSAAENSTTALIDYRQFMEIKNTNPQSFILMILNMARTLSRRLRDKGDEKASAN